MSLIPSDPRYIPHPYRGAWSPWPGQGQRRQHGPFCELCGVNESRAIHQGPPEYTTPPAEDGDVHSMDREMTPCPACGDSGAMCLVCGARVTVAPPAEGDDK